MQMTFTLAQFSAMFPGVSDVWAQAFSSACTESEINTPARVAAHFAQVSHESAGLTRLEEIFAYSAKRLMVVFPTRFRSLAEAKGAANAGPEGIANKVYALRLGNGSESSGDGFRYRGRGPIQLTGKENYRRFGQKLDLPLESKPEQVLLPTVGARIAGSFWKDAGCNVLADVGDFRAITRKVNGGLNGLADREALWVRFKGIMGVEA